MGSAPVTRDAIVLLDSGGQYLDGTTDVTRTVSSSSSSSSSSSGAADISGSSSSSSSSSSST